MTVFSRGLNKHCAVKSRGSAVCQSCVVGTVTRGERELSWKQGGWGGGVEI